MFCLLSKETIKKRIERKKLLLEEAYNAYEALLKGGVQSYAIGSRNLTRLDLAELESTIEKLEADVEILEAMENGQKRQKSFGVVPRDI